MSYNTRDTVVAKVVDNQDPEKRGRLRVSCRALVADGLQIPEWVEPCFPYVSSNSSGWFFVPEPGTLVEIEFIAANQDEWTPGEAYIAEPDYKWRCCLYPEGEALPEEFRQGSYGKIMGVKTPQGSLLLFDDDFLNIILRCFGEIKLGSPEADEPLVLGTALKTFQSTYLDQITALADAVESIADALATHVHVETGATTNVPFDVTAYTAASNTAADVSAEAALLKDVIDDHLSTYVFTQKDPPA